MINVDVDNLEIEYLVELLVSVKRYNNLDTNKEAEENIESGKYTRDDIYNAIVQERAGRLGPNENKETYLPIILKGVKEDYSKLI